MEGVPMVKNPFKVMSDGSLTLPQGQTPSLQFWGSCAAQLEGSSRAGPPGSDEARRINAIRDQLNTKLDAIVPEFGQARSVARGFFGKEDALEAGRDFLDLSVRGGAAEEIAALAKLKPAEKELFAQGLTESVRNRFAAVPNNQEISRLFNTPAIKDRLRLGLGAERAAQLEQYLKVEKTMSQLKGALGTRRRRVDLADLGVIGNILGAGAVDRRWGGVGRRGSLFTDQGLQAPSVSTVLGAMAGGLRAAHGKMNVAAANRVAEMLVSQILKVSSTGSRSCAKTRRSGTPLLVRDTLSSVIGHRAGSY